MVEKACKKCKRLYEGDKCPDCGSSEKSDSYKGKLVVLNVEESEIAKNIGIKQKGTYAVKI